MSDNTPPRATSIATGGSPSSGSSRIINAEVLTEGQRRAVNRYLELSESSGVLIGALAGAAAWDLRPMILEGGALFLLRFSDPALALDKRKFAWLKGCLEQRAARSSGEAAGQLWVKRRYFSAVLAEDPWRETAPVAELFAVLGNLLAQLAALHSQGKVHGHVALSNCAREGQGLVLFDSGFFTCTALTVGDTTIAPESQSIFPPTPSADVYGFGSVARSLLRGEVGTEFAEMLKRTLSVDPQQRPTLESLQRLFVGQQGERGNVGNTPTGNASGSKAPAGKVISATIEPSPPPAAQPVVSPPPVQPPPAPPAAAPQAEITHTLLIPREVIEEARNSGRRAESAQSTPGSSQPPHTQEVADRSGKSSEGLDQAQRSNPSKKLLTAPPLVSRRQALLVAGAIFLLATLLVRAFDIPALLSKKRYDIPMAEYWNSGQKALMQQVAEAAIQGKDHDAQTVIFESAKAASPNPLVHGNILRFASDPQWSGSLSDTDRDTVIRLSLAPLYPDGVKGLPPPQELNPIVLVALLGNLPLDRPATVFESIPAKLLLSLPGPLAKIFAPSVSPSASLAERPIRALAHLALGTGSAGAFQSYFTGGDPGERLRALLPLLALHAQLAPPLLDYLRGGQSILSDYVRWFEAEDLAQWDKLPPRIKLFIMAGEVPTSGLILEQYADLLQFPQMSIRAAAAAALMTNFLGSEHQPTIAFLGGDANQLGRFQTIALLAALKLDADSFYAFLSKWFEAKPDPATILRLLLTRSNSTGIDPLNFQAATYLKRTNWEASLKELSALSQHPEGLARALAYSKLDPAIPNERAILQEALKREPNENFRDEIARRVMEHSR